jgi:protocatechuate 3,4-dioxygenase beta subunit
MHIRRRPLLLGLAATLAVPALATTGRVPLAAMTEGPFYPPRRWRDAGPLAGDWDADLTRVRLKGRVAEARGEHLGLEATVVDSSGRMIDDAEVEIWQCDALAAYRHPNVALQAGAYDEGFQGFGSARSGRDGRLALRTIRPVAYPGRTPHIHVTLRHPAFGEHTSQLFVAGDPGNAGDFLWRRVPTAARGALEMRLQPAPAGAERGLRWVAQHALVVPA